MEELSQSDSEIDTSTAAENLAKECGSLLWERDSDSIAITPTVQETEYGDVENK